MLLMFVLFLVGMAMIVPLILTFLNIINLFKKKRIKENIVDILTFVLGIILTCILYHLINFKDYTEILRVGGGEVEVHAPIASWSMPTVIFIFLIGIISYCLIRIKKNDLPPLVVVCSLSGIIICSTYIVIIFIHTINTNLFEFIRYDYIIQYLLLFPINYILCSIRAVLDVVKIYKEKNLQAREFNNKFLNKCSKFIYNTNNWPLVAIILTIPILIIMICILTLFGQRPDEAIRAFLETSDWNLSQKISPPNVEYDAHYLCTVSLKGHEQLVKPRRIGIRRGKKIIVNRQLCIANAFEDLIEEKVPKFHYIVRHIYDKYGFPLSKHINTPLQADITYILMKPLEWVFLIVLYLFDKNPENRISIQYTGKKLTHFLQ